jgi:alcohol dehydrogenase
MRIEELAAKGGLKNTLSGSGVPLDDLKMLATEAAQQWTGTFNPRPFNSEGALEVYRAAF